LEGEASPRGRKGLQYRIHGGTFSFHDWLTTRMRSAITTTATCDPILNENGKEEARERNGEAGANTHTKDGRAIEPRLLEVGEDIHEEGNHKTDHSDVRFGTVENEGEENTALGCRKLRGLTGLRGLRGHDVGGSE
jgi:hypothetical protein